MDDLSRRIERLSPAKQALLRLRLTQHGIPRRAGEAPPSLSFAQQRLWFLDQLQPRSPVYHIPWAVRLGGELDAEVLRQALGAIVARHEVLRTTFAGGDAGPVQVIGEPPPLPMPLMDLTAVPQAQREAELGRRLVEEVRRPFDLARDPMMRAMLLRVGATEHVLLVTVHHIAADGWSMGVLERELGRLYAGFAQGRPVASPELPIQYADYAVWQRQWLQGEVLERQLGYWKRQLAGVAPVLELPTDRPRPAAQSFAGARRAVRLPGPLADALRALSRREGATLFMTLLAVFQVLLQRYTGQDDIVVGAPIAGRTRVELEPLVGLFVNTLLLRADLSGDPTFRTLLGRVRETALGAYAHQDLPFERLVEELRPERSLARTPLFQVMFALQNVPRPGVELPGLTVSPVTVDTATVPCDLTMTLTEDRQGLSAAISYDTDLFKADTIERMLGHYRSLLAGAVAHPDRPISTLPLLADAERRRILVEWNDTRAPYPADRPVHALFEDQVERAPDAVAVSGGGCQLTYRELDERANRLAHHLRKRGMGPGVPVGICLDRSPEMVVALLGILKAGGAYVPLDPTYPKERLAFMLEDSGASVLVTDARLANALPTTGARVVRLDGDGDGIARESAERPAGGARAESLAYVIYTSGSTGTPKGVAIPHRAISRLVMNINYVRVTAADVMAQVSNASFDAVTFEIWGALLNGARLVVLPKDVVLSPRELAAEIERHGITTMFLTTALFNLVAREVPSAFRGLRNLLVGGEALDPRWMAAVLDHGAPERLLNVYGPTEATTFACCYRVEAVPADATSIPIGRPISNTQAYILDLHLNPVPIGVAGELHLGGPGLAVGYLGRPELTGQKFIPDPFSAEPDARLYRTGDLVRHRPDGNIEFVGRIDRQVKLRGYRIELGEIEAVLGQHPGVREAVISLREDVPGEKRLAAYVVPAGAAVAGADLRGFLETKLPEYMVPAHFVLLERLPLTPNGKVDRAALPVPAAKGTDAAAAGPRDVVELRLVQIWEEVLGTRPVGVHDNFFEIGGHSLLALRLFARLEKELGKSLPLATLFHAPTIDRLAAVIRDEGWAPFGSPLVAIQPAGGRPPLFAVPGVGGNVLGYVDLARRLGPEQPFYGLQARGLDGRDAPLTRIEDIAALHIKKIRKVQPHGPYFLIGACLGGVVVFEMAQQLRAVGEPVGLVGLLDPPRPGPARARHYSSVLPSPMVVPRFVIGRAVVHLRILRRLRPAEQFTYLRDKMRIVAEILTRRDPLRGYRTEINERLVSDANERALRRYLPRPYPGTLCIFLAGGRPVASDTDPRLEWSALAGEGVQIHRVPGHDSGNVLVEPHVGAFAERLGACLEAARAGRCAGGDELR